MSKINTPPRGLQALLGNVNQGENPSELSQTVNPHVDLVPFWGVDKLKSGFVGGSVVGTIGQGLQVKVPTGELWIPVCVSGQYFVPVGETRMLSIRILDPSAGKLVTLRQTRITAATNSAELFAGVALPQRFVLPTGWGFRVQIDESSIATAGAMELNYFYYKIAA